MIWSMGDPEEGWAWFDTSHQSTEPEENSGQIDIDLLRIYSRVFRSEDGRRILRHLRTITLNRALGPSVSEPTLRHLEGQRQLVIFIEALAERGGDFAQMKDLTRGA